MDKDDYLEKYELKDSIFWRLEEDKKDEVYNRYPENL
jgi:hypothetical protein